MGPPAVQCVLTVCPYTPSPPPAARAAVRTGPPPAPSARRAHTAQHTAQRYRTNHQRNKQFLMKKSVHYGTTKKKSGRYVSFYDRRRSYPFGCKPFLISLLVASSSPADGGARRATSRYVCSVVAALRAGVRSHCRRRPLVKMSKEIKAVFCTSCSREIRRYTRLTVYRRGQVVIGWITEGSEPRSWSRKPDHWSLEDLTEASSWRGGNQNSGEPLEPGESKTGQLLEGRQPELWRTTGAWRI